MCYRQRHPDVILQLPKQKSRHFRPGNCKPLPPLCYYYPVAWGQYKGKNCSINGTIVDHVTFVVLRIGLRWRCCFVSTYVYELWAGVRDNYNCSPNDLSLFLGRPKYYFALTGF